MSEVTVSVKSDWLGNVEAEVCDEAMLVEIGEDHRKILTGLLDDAVLKIRMAYGLAIPKLVYSDD